MSSTPTLQPSCLEKQVRTFRVRAETISYEVVGRGAVCPRHRAPKEVKPPLLEIPVASSTGTQAHRDAESRPHGTRQG